MAGDFLIFIKFQNFHPLVYAPNSLGATFLTSDLCSPLNFEPESTNNSPIARSQACIFDFYSKPICLFGTEGLIGDNDVGFDYLQS